MAVSRNKTSLFAPAKNLSQALLAEKFKALLLALHDCDYEAVKKIANDYPQVLSFHDESGNSIYHYALTLNVPEIARFFIRKMQFLNQTEILKQLLAKKNNEGLTCLHLAAGNCDFKTVKFILDSLGELAATSVREVSNRGNLPIELALKNKKLALDEVKQIYVLLEELLFKYTPFSKNIDELLSFEQVLQENLESLYDNDEVKVDLIENLFYATIASNFARKIISISETHPDSNNLSQEDYLKLKTEIETVREKYKNIIKQSSGHAGCDEFFRKLDLFMEEVKAIAQGNCYEYSCIVLYALKNMGIKALANFYNVDNGDHVFVILGKDKNAVAIDAWAGEVYPASKMFLKLYDCHHYPSWDDEDPSITVVPYNPHYHIIRPMPALGYSLNATDIADNAILNPDIFDTQEAEQILQKDAILNQISEQILSMIAPKPETEAASTPRSNLN